MPKDHQYFVYILASRSRNLYIGVTNNLVLRLHQHRCGQTDGFTKRYEIHRLVYFERFAYIDKAIAREKHLKHWTRAEKLALITEANPTWVDLSTVQLGYIGELEKADPPACTPTDEKPSAGDPAARKDDKGGGWSR